MMESVTCVRYWTSAVFGRHRRDADTRTPPVQDPSSLPMCDHTILYDHHLDHHHFSFETVVKAERGNHVTGAVFIIVCHVSGAGQNIFNIHFEASLVHRNPKMADSYPRSSA